MSSYIWYSTLYQAERYALKSINPTPESAQVMALCAMLNQISRRVDRIMSPSFGLPHFAPYKATRSFPIYRSAIRNQGTAFKPYTPVLAATAVSVKMGNTTTAYTDDIEVVNGAIQWTDFYTNWNSIYNRARYAEIVIEGTFGQVTNYSQAWEASTALTADVLTTTATTIEVTDIDATASNGYEPVLSAGNLIQIGTEWMLVTATDTATDIAAVVRGVHGSTASTHASGAVVSRFIVDDNLQHAIARQAGLWYTKRGAFEQQTIQDIVTLSYPADLELELRNVLMGYNYA